MNKKNIHYNSKKDKELSADYSNQILISSRKNEFILDFIFSAPPRPILVKRIAINRDSANALLKTLTQSIDMENDNEEKKYNFSLMKPKVEA